MKRKPEPPSGGCETEKAIAEVYARHLERTLGTLSVAESFALASFQLPEENTVVATYGSVPLNSRTNEI